jgi:fructose-1,6-bisphosphatase I
MAPRWPTLWQCAAGPSPGDGAAAPTPADAADLGVVITAIFAACADVADRLGAADGEVSAAATAAGRDAPKALDVLANEAFKSALASTGLVGLLASEEEDAAVAVPGVRTNKYVAVFDPLDGSSNLASSLPTGSIWGVYRAGGRAGAPPDPGDALQPGSALVAAGYALYSSATVAVLSLGTGRGAHGFTRCPRTGAWLCTHPGIRLPARGQTYSLNDARQADWPPALRRYVDAIRAGKGASGKKYAARYVCALVADLHRTLVGGVGGWAANPRPHLRRVYEAAPLSFVTVAAGGAATDGVADVLDVVPASVHDRAPLWMGSPDDIAELLSYGEVRQGVTSYDV